MHNKTIFILGAYKGQEFEYLLKQGNKIIAIEANPYFCKLLREKFATQISNNTVTIINGAIAEGSTADLYISNHEDWCSCNKQIANRIGALNTVVQVNCINLQDIIDKYSVPYYLRIDIEGNDSIALSQLKCRPLYISCESECIGDTEEKTEYKITKVLNSLKEKGYSKFKIVSGYEEDIKSVVDNFNSNGWMSFEECKNYLLTESPKYAAYHFWKDILATY